MMFELARMAGYVRLDVHVSWMLHSDSRRPFERLSSEEIVLQRSTASPQYIIHQLF